LYHALKSVALGVNAFTSAISLSSGTRPGRRRVG
jgi:hypothetical protein